MSFDWATMTRAERIEAIRPMRQAGATGRHMAAYLNTTRSAVATYISLYLADIQPDKRNKGQNPFTVARRRAGPPKVVAALPSLREIPVHSTKPFMERSMGFECAWIVGDSRAPDPQCCGAPTEFGDSWCKAHREIVFGKAA